MLLAGPPIGHMPQFGAAHLMMLVLVALAAVSAVPLGRWLRGRAGEGPALAAAGWVLLVVAVLWTAWGMLPGNWTVEQSLPFHYSDALRVITAVALISRAPWAIAISYYWGLTLNLQSILTPDLQYLRHPVLEFALYWFAHGAALVAPVLLVWGLGHRPTWRGYRLTLLATVAWAGLATIVNLLTGANYAYLAHAPAGRSILDLLGGWPTYQVWEAVLIATVWALMTWPWSVLTPRRGARRPAGSSRPPTGA